MKQGTRKFLGIILTIVFLAFYALVMMAIGARIFGSQPSGLAQFGFYLLAGAGWLPVVMAIIKWMARPDAE